MATEGVTLAFTDDAIDALARVAVDVNNSVENIGARRLQTVLERVLDDISFTAPDRVGRDLHHRRRLCARRRSRRWPRTPTSRASSYEPRGARGQVRIGTAPLTFPADTRGRSERFGP